MAENEYEQAIDEALESYPTSVFRHEETLCERCSDLCLAAEFARRLLRHIRERAAEIREERWKPMPTEPGEWHRWVEGSRLRPCVEVFREDDGELRYHQFGIEGSYPVDVQPAVVWWHGPVEPPPLPEVSDGG